MNLALEDSCSPNVNTNSKSVSGAIAQQYELEMIQSIASDRLRTDPPSIRCNKLKKRIQKNFIQQFFKLQQWTLAALFLNFQLFFRGFFSAGVEQLSNNFVLVSISHPNLDFFSHFSLSAMKSELLPITTARLLFSSVVKF